MEEFQHALDEFAQSKRPSNPEVARVLREVRRTRAVRPSRRWVWLFAGGGWAAAALLLVLLLQRGGDPSVTISPEPQVLRAVPARVEAPGPAATALALPGSAEAPAPPVAERVLAPSPPATAHLRPRPARASAAPSAPVVAPGVASASGAAPGVAPRLSYEQSLQLARGHVHRIESLIEVIRESGTGTRFASEQRCFAEHHQNLLALQMSAREQVRKIEEASRASDPLSVDLELERLVAQRRSADAIYRDARQCLGAP